MTDANVIQEKPPQKPESRLTGCLVFVALFVFFIWSGHISCESNSRSQSEYSSRISAAEEAENRVAIPGLTAADVILNIEGKGFEISKDFSNGYMAKCILQISDFGSFVIVGGPSPTKISTVSVCVMSNDRKILKSLGKQIVSYISTIQYDSSEPFEAKKWVEKNFGKNAKTTIGNAEFELKSKDKKTVELNICKAGLGK